MPFALLGSNLGHLPHDLRVIVNRFVRGTLKKKAPEKANKQRGRGEQSTPVVADISSDVEEFNTPSNKGKAKAKRAKKPKKILQEVDENLAHIDVQGKETTKDMSDTDTEAEVPSAPFSDPATKYLHRLSATTLLTPTQLKRLDLNGL